MGHLYVIEVGDRVKVGCSRNGASRVKDLLKVIGLPEARTFVSAGHADHYGAERVAHGLLSDRRLEGEWFSATFAEAVAAVESAVGRDFEGPGDPGEMVRSQFRIEGVAYAWLKERAKRDHRSINGQLNAELKARMKQEQGVTV